MTAWGRGWLYLTLALGVHVVDEAATDFLGVYNPIVLSIRSRVPWLPLPTFTFPTWLVGLTLAVLVLLALSRPAMRDARWLKPFAYAFAVLMLGNGLVHVAGSVVLGRPMPGVYSSPFLLTAATYLLVALRRSADGRVVR